MGVLTGIKGTRQGWLRQIRVNVPAGENALLVENLGAGRAIRMASAGVAGDNFALLVEDAIGGNLRLGVGGVASVSGQTRVIDLSLLGDRTLSTWTAGNVRLGTDINPMAYGGFKVAYLFSVANLAANLADAWVEVAGGNGATQITMPYAGSVLAISVYGNAGCIVDGATFEPVHNGVECTQNAVIDSAAHQQDAYVTAAKDTVGNTFAAGEYLACHVTTTLGFLPAGTTEYVVVIVVEF